MERRGVIIDHARISQPAENTHKLYFRAEKIFIALSSNERERDACELDRDWNAVPYMYIYIYNIVGRDIRWSVTPVENHDEISLLRGERSL